MLLRAIAAFALALSAIGCNAGDSCDEIRDRVEACYGAAAADAFGEGATCEPEQSDYMQSLDCDQLARAIAGGKADDTLGTLVAEAIREGLRIALAQGFDAMYAQLEGAGIDRDAFAPFLLLSRHDTREAANLKRNELSQILDPRQFSPIVVPSGDGYDVIHSACPINTPELIADQISDAIIGAPSFLSAIGTELEVEETESGQTIRFPLSLALFGTDVADGFGCE